MSRFKTFTIDLASLSAEQLKARIKHASVREKTCWANKGRRIWKKVKEEATAELSRRQGNTIE
jgi:hypothetical protein